MDSSTPQRSKACAHICVFFLILALGWILHPDWLPAMGIKVCAVFLALLYGWSFIGFAWPSMICILALGFSGHGSPGKILGQAFAHPVVLFTIFVLVFTSYCDKSGLNEYMAKWLLSRRILAGRPWLFSCCVLIGTLIIGFLIDGVPAVFLISGLLYSIFKDVGYKPGEKFPAFLLAGVCIAGVLSFACKPWMGQNILGINALAEISGDASVIGNLTLIGVIFPVCVAALLVYLVLIHLLFKPDVFPLAGLSLEYLANLRSDLKVDRQQKIAAVFLAIFLIFMILPNILPTGSPLSAFFGQFTMTVAITSILGVLSFITVEGKPVFDFQGCSNGINLNVIWMLASSIPVSAALSSEGAGIAKLLTEGLSNLSTGSPLVFLGLFTILASIIT